MSVAKRLKTFINHLDISDQEFEKQCNMSGGSAMRLTSKSYDKTFNKIQKAFPELNIDWLKTGVGEMLKDSDKVDGGYWVPLIPISVMAGELTEYNPDGVLADRCERIVSPIKGVDMAFPVYGDSMEPEYPGGSNVFVKKINFTDFIPYGNVFVLDTTNGPLLKKVQRSEKDGCIRCVSLNTAAGYEPFDVPLRTVRNMYRVLMCLSIKG